MDEYLSLQLLPACTNRAVLGGALLLLNINCYPENYWATQFLDRPTPLRRYNVGAALKIETCGGLAS